MGLGTDAQMRGVDMAFMVGCDQGQWLVRSKKESLREELRSMAGLAPRNALHAVRHDLGHSGEPRF